MAEYGIEGRRLLQRLQKLIDAEGLTDSKVVGVNYSKKVRRALGSAYFSPDNVYMDMIEEGLRKGDSAKEIVNQIRNKSESLVKTYTPVTGVYEPHHIVALNSLRDAYIDLQPQEQIDFIKRLSDLGWELGDAPRQLADTVISSMSHQGRVPVMKKGGATGIKKGFQGLETPDPDVLAHVGRKLYDPSLQAKPTDTAADLYQQFDTKLAPEQVKAAVQSLVHEVAPRIKAAEAGLDLVNPTPEKNKLLLSSPEGGRIIHEGSAAFAKEYKPIAPEQVSNTLKEAGIDLQKVGPTTVEEASEALLQLNGYSKKQIAKMAAKMAAMRGVQYGAALVPLVGLGLQAGEVKSAEESGDEQRVAEETAQLGLEAASTVVPVADVVNIATDVGQTYRDLREQGVSHRDMLEAGVELAGEAIRRPDKVVRTVGSLLKDVPQMTLDGYKYMYKKAEESLTSAPIPLGY